MQDFEIRTLAGGRIILSERRPYAGPKSGGDPQLQEAIRAHVTRCVGPISGVFSFPAGMIRLEVLWVAPSENRRFHLLVTCGMAERPMHPPPDAVELSHAEILICLPPEWPIDLGLDGLNESDWPLQLLGRVARYAHENRTWVWRGHTIGAPRSGGSFAPDTRLTCVALGDPAAVPFAFRVLETADGRMVYFFNLIPIYSEELRLAMWRGTDFLLDRLEAKEMTRVLDVHRQSVAGGRTWARLGAPATILQFPHRP